MLSNVLLPLLFGPEIIVIFFFGIFIEKSFKAKKSDSLVLKIFDTAFNYRLKKMTIIPLTI
jgi:hypothetical protein